jgi:ABC-2 type transport system permease protein
MTEGVVYDLGYRPHEGPRLGRRGARRALYRDGLRRVLGLRRRTRRKVLPVVLIAAAVLPALFFVAVSVLLGQFDVTATLFGHSQYFDLTSTLALLFVALAASELLVPDRIHGVMSVYASRPITDGDYVAARTASLATVVIGFLWLPHVVLFLGRAAVGDFGRYIVDNWMVLHETMAASLAYFAAFAPLAFAIAALSKRSSVASGAFLGLVVMSGPMSGALVGAGNDVIGLLAIQHHPGVVKDWVMGTTTRTWIPHQAGFEPVVSLLAIAVLTAISAYVVVRQVRRAG